MGVRIREEDDGWWIYICHRGRRKAKRVGPGATERRTAQEIANKLRAKLILGDVSIFEHGPVPGVAVPTFEALAMEWMDLQSPAWKGGTKTAYLSLIRNRLIGAFGSFPVSRVTPALVENWWATTRGERKGGRPLSRCSLQMLRSLLTAILERAVVQGVIRANPAARIQGRLGRQGSEIKRSDYLSAEDLTAFLATAERIVPSEFPPLLVMATCGLRIGEAVSLQVGDLDVPGLRLHVRRTVSGRGAIGSPKSGRARVVDVPGPTMRVLKEVRETKQAEAAYTGREARWLFPGKDGQSPIAPELVERGLRGALRAAGLRRIRPHDLRHTYATLAIQAGVALLTVSRQLGHASIATTVDIYGHAVPGSNRAAAAAMEAILNRQEAGAEQMENRRQVGTIKSDEEIS